MFAPGQELIGGLIAFVMRCRCLHIGVSIAVVCLTVPMEAAADERLPGIRTAAYMSMPESERIALVVGASHVLAQWMRVNGELELNCFYNRGTYSDVVKAVDTYISETPSAHDKFFSQTLINALASACDNDLDRYLVN